MLYIEDLVSTSFQKRAHLSKMRALIKLDLLL